eukprot:196457_1
MAAKADLNENEILINHKKHDDIDGSDSSSDTNSCSSSSSDDSKNVIKPIKRINKPLRPFIKNCIIGLLLVVVLMISSFIAIWFYISNNILPKGSTDINNVDINLDHINVYISLSNFPTNATSIILAHTPGTPITEEENDLLTYLFDTFDTDGNGEWGVDEFSLFMNLLFEPETKFDDIDINGDSKLTHDELSVYLATFYRLDAYKTTMTSNIIENIFKYKYNTQKYKYTP